MVATLFPVGGSILYQVWRTPRWCSRRAGASTGRKMLPDLVLSALYAYLVVPLVLTRVIFIFIHTPTVDGVGNLDALVRPTEPSGCNLAIVIVGQITMTDVIRQL